MHTKKRYLKTVLACLFGAFLLLQKNFAASFSSATNGLWNTPGTWTLNSGTDGDGIPDSDDDVSITHNVTLDVAAPTVASLAITGGSLVGPFNITVTGLLTIGGGTLNNTGSATASSLDINNGGALIGSIGATGTVTITGAASIGTGSLIGKTLELQGTTTKIYGTFNVSRGGVFRNAASGTLTLANGVDNSTDFGGDSLNGPTGIIANLGTIGKNVSSTIDFQNIVFNNSSMLTIGGGAIRLNYIGNFTGGSVDISSGSYLLLVPNTFTGTGAYTFSGGSVTGGGTMTVGNYTGTTTATFSASAGFSANLQIKGGTVTDNTAGISPMSVTIPNVYPGGTYQGSGSPAISGNLYLGFGIFNPGGNVSAGSMDWTGGQIGASAGTASTITVSGAVNISGNDTKDFYKKSLTCMSGATSSALAVNFYGCTLTIPASTTLTCDATFGDIKFGALVSSGTVSGTLNLNGTLNKTGGNILFLKNIQINNNGAMIFGVGTTEFTGENDIQYSGTGTVEVGSGATIWRFNGPLDVVSFAGPTFTNNGTLKGFSVNFTGTGNQTLAGNGTVVTGGQGGLLIDKTSGTLDITGSPTFNYFTFTNGKALIENGDLTLNANYSLSGYTSNKYFATLGTGRLVLPINGQQVFPVGTATTYNPVTITPGGNSTFGVRVKQGFDYTIGGPDYVDRQWQVDRTSGSGSATLKFQWNTGDIAGSFTSSNCHISRYNGSNWETFGNAAATCPGDGTCNRTVSGVANFSPFGVASGTALPIELTSFRGQEAGTANHLEWQTASESNTKDNQLQRSADGISGWKTIAERGAAGNSNTPVQYEADDQAPPREAYYRVLFEDLDGQTDFSPIVYIKRKGASGGQFSVYPNPVEAGGFWLNAAQEAVGEVLAIRVFDAAGRLIAFTETEAAAEAQFVPMENQLPAGAYFLKISSETVAQTLPILVR